MAIWRRGKPEVPLHHPDQCGQYISQHSQDLVDENGVICSMRRSTNV